LEFIVPVHCNLYREGEETRECREPLFQNPINLGALCVAAFPVGDDVLVDNDDIIVAPNDVGRIDLGIAAGVDNYTINCVKAKLPAMVVLVSEASNIVRADPS
jgi:hypothetical protein